MYIDYHDTIVQQNYCTLIEAIVCCCYVIVKACNITMDCCMMCSLYRSFDQVRIAMLSINGHRQLGDNKSIFVNKISNSISVLLLANCDFNCRY